MKYVKNIIVNNNDETQQAITLNKFCTYTNYSCIVLSSSL